MPFCLSVQAIFFYLPHLIWQALSVNTLGDNLNYLIKRAKDAATSDDPATRAKLVEMCANQLHHLSRQHSPTNMSRFYRFRRSVLSHLPIVQFFVFGKRLGNRTAILYLFIKLLYILNVTGQLFLIMCFLEPESNRQISLIAFSKRLFNVTTSRREWGGSELFPLQALCPVRVPILGNRFQTYTAICALPVNMLNEKMYLFLWVWIFAVLVISVLSTLTWMSRLLFKGNNEAFILSFLNVSLSTSPSPVSPVAVDNTSSPENAFPTVEQFVQDGVRCDGNFLIRMLRLNAGDVITSEILVAWWNRYKSGK